MMYKYKYLLVMLSLTIGMACNNDKRYIDKTEVSGYVVKDSTNAIELIKAFQANLNKEFKDAATSPLTTKDKRDFKGLAFFDIDTTFRVVATFEETPFEPSFEMPTTTSRSPEYKRYGIAQFTLKGKKYSLDVYQSQELKLKEGFEDYLFIPFLDETNGAQTYGGGRYIDASIPKGKTMIIDFNMAYNPYCAYNKKYSCPIVPEVNRLTLPVTVGVKKFKDH